MGNSNVNNREFRWIGKTTSFLLLLCNIMSFL